MEWFKEFKELATKYSIGYNAPLGHLSEREQLRKDYSKWSNKILNSLKSMDIKRVLEYKQLIPIACTVSEKQCEDDKAAIQNRLAIAFGVLISILIYIVSEGENTIIVLIAIGVVAVLEITILCLAWCKYWKPKRQGDYIQFLYYSALLSILDTMGNDGVADYKCAAANTGTVSNPSLTKGATKSKYKKKRKGIRK